MIAIIDYRAGNLTSVKLAFEALAIEAEITDSPEVILNADRVVFPGVGAAGAAMQNLQELKLAETIRSVVRNKTPFLGICLGTQIIFEHSEEDNGVDCIGLIPGNVKRFTPTDPYDKVPHMGWNRVQQKNITADGKLSPPTENSTLGRLGNLPDQTNIANQKSAHPIFEGIADNSEFYFVHSFYPAPSDPDWIIGSTDYAGTTFASAVARENLVATQFHPEKSGKIGLQLLKNFCNWNPEKA